MNINDRVLIVPHPDHRFQTQRVGKTGTIVGHYIDENENGLAWYDVEIDGETVDGKPHAPVHHALELELLGDAPTVEDES